MSEPTELKPADWRAPLTNEKFNQVIESPRRTEEISDQQRRINMLKFELELSQLEQIPARVRLVNLEETESLLLGRFHYVQQFSKMRKDTHCVNCGRPTESSPQEFSVCADCRDVPNLFLG